MATMYVYNIPTNETVNLRKTPSTSGTILVRVGYGKAVQASYYNSTWHSASYSGYSGYIMSKFLSSTDPDGGGSSGGGGTPTAGVIQGTSVRVRSQPNTSSTILTQVNTGDKVTYYAGETYSGSGYTWYRCTGSKWSGDGYIATNYVVKDNSGGGTGGGGSYLGQGTVIGGGPLYCRKQPQAGYESWGQFQEGTVIPIYSCSTSGWYETRWPASGSNVGYVMSQFISLNSGGGGSSYTVGKFGATNTGAVFVRKSAGGTEYSTTEKLRLGSTFLIAGTTVKGSTTWVKVRYGTATGGSTDAYISGTYFDELASTPSTAKERCIQIAKSLDGVHESVLGLSGDCCQQFIYWLCGACGKTVNNMPYNEGYCGPARDYFNNLGKYQTWTANWANSHRPYPGDLVYYGTPGATTSPHVGLVVSVNPTAKTYTSIECNLSDRVKKCTGDYAAGYCADNGYSIQGFASPTWT